MFFNVYAYVHIGRLGIMVKFQYKRPTELKKLSGLCKVDICTILKSLCPELIYLSTAASLFFSVVLLRALSCNQTRQRGWDDLSYDPAQFEMPVQPTGFFSFIKDRAHFRYIKIDPRRGESSRGYGE